MLRGSRSIIIALGLAFCIFFASGGAYWLFSSASSLQARYEQAAKNRSHNYAQRRDIIIKDRCSPLAGTDKAKCINEEREAAREGDRKEYGLEAQRITAAWTAHMGIAAIIGMVASLIGVGLVWTTFHETRIANIIARDIAKRELKAYMSFDDVIGFSYGNQWHPQLRFKNCGNTPARMVWGHGSWIATSMLHKDFPFPEDAPNFDDGPAAVGPGQSLTAICQKPILWETFEDVLAGRTNIFIWGAVDYLDIYGDRRRTEFAGRASVTSPEKDKVDFEWHVLNRHNGMDEECVKRTP